MSEKTEIDKLLKWDLLNCMSQNGALSYCLLQRRTDQYDFVLIIERGTLTKYDIPPQFQECMSASIRYAMQLYCLHLTQIAKKSFSVA